jgi:hypothetical protein
VAAYTIQDENGRQLDIDVDGELTPEIVEQAFANYDALKIKQAGPVGSEGRRRARADVVRRETDQSFVDESGGAQSGALKSGAASAGQAISSTGGGALAALGRIGTYLTDAIGGPISGQQVPAEELSASRVIERSQDNPLVQAGQSIQEQGRVFYPVNPDQKVANVVGGAVGSGITMLGSGPAAIPSYALSAGEQGMQDALAAGATPEQAVSQGLIEAGTGAVTERALGLVPGLKEAARGTMRGIARPTVKAAIGEAVQEPLEGTLNRAASKFVTGADPNAKVLDPETLALEALGGLAGGGGVGGTVAVANARDRAARLAEIRRQRDPFNQFNEIVETAPIDSPQMALVAETSRRPAPVAPPDLNRFAGMGTDEILAQVQSRMADRQRRFAEEAMVQQMAATADVGLSQAVPGEATTPIDQFISNQVRQQRRQNVEAGLNLPQVQPVEPTPEPVIGQYPPEGFGTGTIVSPEEQARRAQVRRQAEERGRARQQLAAQEINQPVPFTPTPQVPVPPVSMAAPALAVAARQQVAQRIQVARQRAAAMQPRQISTSVIDVLANENQVPEAGSLPDVQRVAPQPQAEDQAPVGAAVQEGANPQVVEKIVSATVQIRGSKEVFEGPTHGLAVIEMWKAHPELESEQYPSGIIEGFKTSNGRIVSRAEAAKISGVQSVGNEVAAEDLKLQSIPTKPGARLRKSPLRSEPAAASRLATLGAGAVASPTAAPALPENDSVFGIRSYAKAKTITPAVYNQVNEFIDSRISQDDPVAKEVRRLDMDAEIGVRKTAGYDQLTDQGKFEAVQRYRNKLYQAAEKWAAGGTFTFNQATIAKSAAMDVGKSQAEILRKSTSGEEAVGESETETNLTRATQPVSASVKLSDPVRVKQDVVGILRSIQTQSSLSDVELARVVRAFQDEAFDDLSDKELLAIEANRPTLEKLANLNFSVSSLITEPIGLEAAQEAVDQWLSDNGDPQILIRVVDDPNLKTPDGRNVAAQIELTQGGQPIITINAAQIGSAGEVREKIWHELLHTVWGDTEVQAAWAEVLAKLSEQDVRSQLARGYSPGDATMEAAIDAASVRAANTSIRPAWKRFLDSIWQAMKKAFGFESRPANFEQLMVSALRSAAGPWNGQQQNRYNQDVQAKDKAYLEAVARGDMATAQKMVDEAAKAAGFTTEGFHVTNADFNVFDIGKSKSGRSGKGFYFSQTIPQNARGSRVVRAFLKSPEVSQEPQRIFRNSDKMTDREFVVRDPSQIKSADPVTYDDAGNVVLLSQRFNPVSRDIRYSVANNLYVTRPTQFKRIAEEGQAEAVVAQGQTASAIIPQSTLDEIDALKAKQNPTPVEKAMLSNVKAVRSIAEVAAVADQIRQANEGWGNYRTLEDLPEAFRSVAAQSVMATHLYLNQRYKSLQNRRQRVASRISDIAAKLDELSEPRLLALVSNQEADQLLKDLQKVIDIEVGKIGTSSASRTREELDRASAAVVGLRQKQDAISAALQTIAKEMPLADFASPEAMKAWIESRDADKTKPQLMTEEISTAIRASLKPGSGLPNRLSLIRGLMLDTAAAKAQIKELRQKVGNKKTALKTIIDLKVDANSVLNKVASLDKAMEGQLIQLDGLDGALALMDRMQESPQYQARVESAFRYGGFRYSGIIRYTDRPNGDQTIVGPSGTEYRVNFTPDFTVEAKNLEEIGKWMMETISALNNQEDPNYITDPAKRTSYANMLAFVSRYMTDRRWLNETAWDDSTPVQLLSLPLMALEKAGLLKAAFGDHLDTRYNAYRLMAGRAGTELVKRSQAIDLFGAKAKNLIEKFKEPMATARRAAILSHGFDPDDAADLAIWNRKVNSWILSQNQNPGSTPVKVGDSLGEGLTATKEDMVFAEMQHRFSRELGDVYAGTIVEGEIRDPEAPGLSPEEKLFDLDFSRKAMQYGYAVGRQFSEAGMEYTREWMDARAKDLAEYRKRVDQSDGETEVTMVWDNRIKVAEEDIEGHVYSHIRETSTDYTHAAGKDLRAVYRELSKEIRRGTHYRTVAEVAEAVAASLSTDENPIGGSEALDMVMKGLDKDVVNYNRTTEIVTSPSNDPTVSDLPKALASVRSAKGALVKARGKMVAPSFFYDYSLDTDAKKAGMVQMGKQALQISEINAARNMLAAMRAKLAEYDTRIEARAQTMGRNGKKIGTAAATRELEKSLRKQFKAGELMITYQLLRRMSNKLEVLIKDREDALARHKIMEEEAFKVAMLNAGKGLVASTLLSAPAPIINNLTAVVLDPLRLGLMHGGIGLALSLYSKQAGRAIKYVFQRTTDKLLKKLGLVVPKAARERLAELSSSLFTDMLTRRQELEDSATLDAAEPFASIWARYKANPKSFGDSTRARETVLSRAVSSLLTSPALGKGLIPASFEYLRQRFPGSGDRMVNQLNSMIEKELSDRIKPKLWLWVDGQPGATRAEKLLAATDVSLTAEDLGLTEEQFANYRTTYGPTGSLERLAMDYYQRNPEGAKGPLLTKEQRDAVVFEIISLTNKEVDSTRPEITKGGAGISGALRGMTFFFQRYALQLLGAQKRVFGVKGGSGWKKELGQALAYLFLIAMTLFTGASVLPLKQLARAVFQQEPLTSPTIGQVAENPELMGKYLTAAAGGVMPIGATLVGAAMSGQPMMGPVSANVLENNPIIGAVNNLIGAGMATYQSGDPTYPALDWARKQFWFTQPFINALTPGDTAAREAKRAVRTGAVGMEVRETGGAPAAIKSTPMTPIIRDAVAALYEGDDAKFQELKQRAINQLMESKGIDAKEAEKRFDSSVSGRDPFRSVLGRNPTDEEMETILARSTPAQRSTLSRARSGFSLRKKGRRRKGLKLRGAGRRTSRRRVRLRRSSRA